MQEETLDLGKIEKKNFFQKKKDQIKEWFSKTSKRQRILMGVSITLVVAIILGLLLLKGLGLGKWGDTDSSLVSSKEATSSGIKEAKDHVSPLDGVMVTKTEYEEMTSKAVLGVVFDNHFDARPHVGLNKADLIYEALAEGGITRFLVFYLRQDADQIGPVRSARIYFLDWVSEFDSLFAHVGGANTPGQAETNALGKIIEYGIKDLDQFQVGRNAYWRGGDKYAPHNVYSTTQMLWDEAEKRGLNEFTKFDVWEFKEEAAESKRPSEQSISFDFGWGQNLYEVTWDYDQEENIYYRTNGGVEQKDKDSDEKVSTKNIAIQFTNQYSAGNKLAHIIIDTQGEGKALIIRDGKVIEGIWKKESRTSRTKFFNLEEKEIKFNRGRTWVEVIPNGTDIEYGE